MTRTFRIQNLEAPETMRSIVVIDASRANSIIEAGREASFDLEQGGTVTVSDQVRDPSNLVDTSTGDQTSVAAIRAASTSQFNDEDVRRLVIAAREVLDSGDLDLRDEGRSLDKALEAFSASVPYEDEGDRAEYAAHSQDTSEPLNAPPVPRGPLSDDQISQGAATPTLLPGESEENPDLSDHTNTMPGVANSEASAIARSSATGGGIGAPNVTVADSDIENGNRPTAHEGGGPESSTGQTGSAGTAEAFDEATQLRNTPEGEGGKGDPAPTYTMRHRGGGSYSLMDEKGNEVVDGLKKSDADSYRSMSDEEKADFANTAIRVREAENKGSSTDATQVAG